MLSLTPHHHTPQESGGSLKQRTTHRSTWLPELSDFWDTKYLSRSTPTGTVYLQK